MSHKQAKQSNKKASNVESNASKWTQCVKCEVLILLNKDDFENDYLNRQHECFNLNDLVSHEKLFMFDNFLCLNPAEHPKELNKDLDIGKEYLFDFALVNPITMKLANLLLGDTIQIEYYEQGKHFQTINSCWPLSSIEPGQISLQKFNSTLNGLILNADSNLLVRKVNKQNIKLASNVAIEFMSSVSAPLFLNDNDDNDLQIILSFLKEIYLNKTIVIDQMLFITYLGQKLLFKTVKIESIDGTKTKTKIQEDLSHDFNQKLSLNKQEEKLKPIRFDAEKFKFDFFNKSNNLNMFRVDRSTKFGLLDLNTKADQIENVDLMDKVYLKQVAGLDKEVNLLKEFFVDPFEFNELYKKIGVNFNKGVLLYGPSGCGKTTVAKAICNETKCNYIELKTSDIYSRNYGESEAKLKKLFAEAWKKSPCILLIDEIDTLCTRRETLNQESEKRLVSLFSNLVDQSKSKEISFLCTTNKPDMIDLSLRRPGRIDKEIEIPIPNQSARYLILKSKLEKLNHNLTENDLTDISQSCHGYVGADLEMLVQEAALTCVKRLIEAKTNEAISLNDFKLALHKVKPSAMREISFDIPKVLFDQIGGQQELKKKLKQAIIWPIKHAESFKRLNIKPPKGLLMYGPPGCSKTMIAKALATETGLNFIAVKGPELFSKWVGESERMVREIFRKARNAAPAIIFFDEIDAIAAERSSSANKSNNVGDRVLAQMLNEIDGIENLNDVTIVAATNRPDMIDKALMRPGRLDRIVYVPLPDRETRSDIFKIKLKEIPIGEDVNLEYLVDKTESYSGAEIASVCNEAAFMALDSDINSTHVTMKHFEMALAICTPRTSKETISYFENFSFNS